MIPLAHKKQNVNSGMIPHNAILLRLTQFKIFCRELHELSLILKIICVNWRNSRLALGVLRKSYLFKMEREG